MNNSYLSGYMQGYMAKEAYGVYDESGFIERLEPDYWGKGSRVYGDEDEDITPEKRKQAIKNLLKYRDKLKAEGFDLAVSNERYGNHIPVDKAVKAIETEEVPPYYWSQKITPKGSWLRSGKMKAGDMDKIIGIMGKVWKARKGK